ncbi:amidohydrolase [Roseivirga sp. BDSF3-8]|uniref:amidohydrolase n=1 Tax=Roseivirga sp. BDSF3-8 TaxID=3241598 RepID=UPI0035326A53
MKKTLLLAIGLLILGSCTQNTSETASGEQADLIVHNARVYTVDSSFTVAQAFAVKDGKFVKIGSDEEIKGAYAAKQTLDAGGKPVYPGFHDAHSHFFGYGLFLQDVNLVGSRSLEEIMDRIAAHREKYPNQEWIVGRGWDQNLWEDKSFPENSELNRAYPDVPVFLTRIDGHAALVNEKALTLAQVEASTPVEGGKILLTGEGIPSGVLIDNGVDLVQNVIPTPTREIATKGLKLAQKNCFEVGLTSICDAGLAKGQIDLVDSLQKSNDLQIRMYAMANPNEENLSHFLNSGPYKTERLTVTGFKVYADGALGSRGACLLKAYADDPENYGLMVTTKEQMEELAARIHAGGFQMNTHAIGDSANRVVLNIYAENLGGKNDRRWRVEHAQVVNPADIASFGQYSIIPSVQPTHATSDMDWADERLGEERIAHAYAYKDLLAQNGHIPLGSDFPVEQINPLYGFHAAVARKAADGHPDGGFQMKNSLSREEALRGMTIWAAYANFEDEQKGSIENGKVADFVILEEDLMEAPESSLRDIKVTATYVDGREVYKK